MMNHKSFIKHNTGNPVYSPVKYSGSPVYFTGAYAGYPANIRNNSRELPFMYKVSHCITMFLCCTVRISLSYIQIRLKSLRNASLS